MYLNRNFFLKTVFSPIKYSSKVQIPKKLYILEHNNKIFVHLLRPRFQLTGPQPVEQLQVVNVSSSQVWLRWMVQASRHAAISHVHVSLLPSDGSEARTVILNASSTEHSFRSAHNTLSTAGCSTASCHSVLVWECCFYLLLNTKVVLELEEVKLKIDVLGLNKKKNV